jgi:transposase
MNLPPELPISAEDWENTPATVQAVVILLWQENQTLKAQVAKLEQQVEGLQVEVGKLRERVNKNSQNSSKPPSSDPPQTPRYPKPEPSGAKKGGQQGHHGHGRKLKSPGEVSRIVKSLPTVCQKCGTLLLGEDLQPERHQVSEVPKIVSEIVEYQRHTLECGVCGARNRAEWPQEMPTGSFGERLQGWIAYLGGRFGVSQRDMEELLKTVFQVEMGLGSIPAQEQRVSQALKQPVEAAQDYVQTQTAVHLDETGWHERTQNVWLWVCATSHLPGSRWQRGRGVVGGSLRWHGRFGPLQRLQLARPAPSPGMLGAPQARFPGVGRVRWRIGGHWTPAAGPSPAVLRLVASCAGRNARSGRFPSADAADPGGGCQSAGDRCRLDHRETRRTSQNILKVSQAQWAFADREGVEPTNNAAERALCRGVIWRRRSYGTQSDHGSQFVERILTAVMTLRQQNRDVLEYLTAACRAANLGNPAPSLLPVD